ncbi:hypothetical protein JWJ90_02410 [Desulfobulbus rhabdoformis]|uniref:hypothetical protein n=1 Tax=Desulfobulbus rhabdoformis TaxID=34032 RepID=UPI001962B854|nr:hypothetical protein [Desulfobulbus rhabdoformis]MBM9613134.1 hypothetical protein [Desulfobulbus rhabdoformis]
MSSNTVAVQLLAINEANAKTPSPSIIPQTFDTGKPILAGYLKKVEAKMPGATFFLHAGDQNQIRLSGLPQQSSASETNLFTMLGNSHCRPTGGYDRECNFIGIPGNNEFIQGVQEMLHLLYESRDGQSSYQQNSFPSICTNLVETESEHPVFQPYVVRLVDGVPIGFIGALLKTEHNAELVKNKEHLAIRDEAESVNEYVKILQGLGVHTIVVMIHQGNEKQAALPSKNLSEHKIRLQTMLAQLDSEVDVVLCGQSHSYNNTLVEGKSGKKMLVVQAWPQENGVAQIQLQISRASAEVVAMRSTVHSTQKGMESYQKKANVASLNAQGQTNTQQPAPSTGPRIAFPENRETM